MKQVIHWEKGLLIFVQYTLLQQSHSILPKIESMKPYSDNMYYTSPGPIFHIDSEYEVRNQILDVCHVSWADLC